VAKNKKRKYVFSNCKICLSSFFFHFDPFVLSNFITFLFLIHFKLLKVLQEWHLKFYKSSSKFYNSNSNKANKEFDGCLRIGICSVEWFFFEFLNPSTLGGHNFLISDSFSKIVSMLDVQEEEFKFQTPETMEPPTPPWIWPALSA